MHDYSGIVTKDGKRENCKLLYLIRHATTLKPRVTAVPALLLTMRHFSTFAHKAIRTRDREITEVEKEKKRKGRKSNCTGVEGGGERRGGGCRGNTCFTTTHYPHTRDHSPSFPGALPRARERRRPLRGYEIPERPHEHSADPFSQDRSLNDNTSRIHRKPLVSCTSWYRNHVLS